AKRCRSILLQYSGGLLQYFGFGCSIHLFGCRIIDCTTFIKNGGGHFSVGCKAGARGSLATASATKQRSDAGAFGCSIRSLCCRIIDLVAVSTPLVAESPIARLFHEKNGEKGHVLF